MLEVYLPESIDVEPSVHVSVVCGTLKCLDGDDYLDT